MPPTLYDPPALPAYTSTVCAPLFGQELWPQRIYTTPPVLSPLGPGTPVSPFCPGGPSTPLGPGNPSLPSRPSRPV